MIDVLLKELSNTDGQDVGKQTYLASLQDSLWKWTQAVSTVASANESQYNCEKLPGISQDESGGQEVDGEERETVEHRRKFFMFMFFLLLFVPLFILFSTFLLHPMCRPSFALPFFSFFSFFHFSFLCWVSRTTVSFCPEYFSPFLFPSSPGHQPVPFRQ